MLHAGGYPAVSGFYHSVGSRARTNCDTLKACSFYWRVPPFFLHTAQVARQLASAHGLLGYSVLARPLSKRFWTLSAWKDEAALRAFVQDPPHVLLMAALASHMGETKFVCWMVKGSQLPLRWEDALRRFSSSPL